MSEQDYEQLTLFQGDSPASRSVQPGSAEAVRMTVTSGQRCCELLKNFSPLGLLAKTLLESSTWHSTQCFLTWKAKATKQGRLYFQLAASTPRIAGTDAPLWLGTMTSSQTGGNHSIRSPERRKGRAPTPAEVAAMWPTPTARDYRGANSMEHLQREGKQNHRKQLNNAVKLWPTPVASDYKRRGPNSYQKGLPEIVRLLPTPKAQNALGAGQRHGEGGPSLDVVVGGQLHPDWVEAMMGFPIGWTALEPDGQTGHGKQESTE